MSVTDTERLELEELDARIEQWIALLRDQDLTQIEHLVATAEQWALRLDEQLPPSLGAEALAEIRGIMIGALRNLKRIEELVEKDGEDRTLDVLDDFVVRAESIRHIVRDTLDEDLGVDPEDAGALAQLVLEALPGATRRELADLFGVDIRTLQRWLQRGDPIRSTHRVLLVAQLVQILKSAWTANGVVGWFHRPNRDLGFAGPVDLLDDPANEQDLLRVARGGKAQHGL